MGCSNETAKQHNRCSNSTNSSSIKLNNQIAVAEPSHEEGRIQTYRQASNDGRISTQLHEATSQIRESCGSRYLNHNCHWPLTLSTATSGQKSNNNDSCPIPIPQTQVGTSSLKPKLRLETPSNINIVTTVTTATIQPNNIASIKSTARGNEKTQSLEEKREDKDIQSATQCSYFHSPRDEAAATTTTTTSTTKTTEATTTTTAHGMTPCSTRTYTVQEMLTYARNVLTAHLSSVSNKLIDNISYYAAVATTVRCAKATHKRQPKRNKKKKQAQRRLSRHYCQLQASYDNSSISKAPATVPAPIITTTKTTSSALSSSSSSLPASLSAIACIDCDTARSSPSASVSVTASATGTPNYIGHSYYHLLRNTISFYAASSVILVLCYLTTTTSAAAANSEPVPLETHPIANIDWSKFDESSSDKEILDLLLEKKRYDKRLLPPVNDEDFCCGLSSPDMAINQNTRRPHHRGTLTVNVNVLLLSLASPDESSLKYEVEFLLNQQWSDPRLQYGNKSHYDFLNALHHHDSIWTPDTYFIMHGDFKDPIIPMHFALRIYRNGTITYAMRRHLILSCQGSLHIFPFDDPKCSFSMESISYEVAQIKYVWKNDEDTLRKSPSLTSLNAYLIKNQTTACEQTSWRGNYSCLRVDLIFTRDRAFYFTTVFIPGIILVTSSFITFWLEWNAVPARSMIGNYSCLQVALTFTRDRAYYFTTVFIPGIILVTSSFITFWLEWNAVPARVMIGVTTMLNFFTTSNGFRSTLPVVSNLTAMNVWDGVCMCFIYASLLEFVCVNYVGRKRPLHNVVYRPGENPVTQRLPAVLSRIGVILASPLEIIEREFQTALSSEKAAAGLSSAGTTMPHTPTSSTPHIHWDRNYGTGMIGTAVKSLRARSMRRRCDTSQPDHGHAHSHSPAVRWYVRKMETKTETETDIAMAMESETQKSKRIENIYEETKMPQVITTELVTNEADASDRKPEKETLTTQRADRSGSDSASAAEREVLRRKRSHSIATNTPTIVIHAGVDGGNTHVDIHADVMSSPSRNNAMLYDGGRRKRRPSSLDIEAFPVRPPRKKTSRSTSPTGTIYEVVNIAREGVANLTEDRSYGATEHVRFSTSSTHGEKRRDAGAPNEIVACTTCGGSSSPCTHSANNGCATETCFVQVRKKEPPHPIRVAKTIDVIARITFPTAYAIFLIFFFVHYKGFS